MHLHILTKSLFPSTQQHGKPVEANSARGDKKLYGKDTRQIYGSTCSFSSNIKDDLPKAKEKSKKREKHMGGLFRHNTWEEMIIIRRKGVRTKS